MENGCFPKRGYVHSSYLKGGGRDSSLTPFIVTALLQAATSPKLDILINYKRLAEGVDCMMKSLNESDKYASILTAHSASLLVNKLGGDLKTGFTIDPKTDEEAVNLLDKLVASANTSLPDAKFWEIEREETPCRWYWGCRASSESVEMTAYMIQSLVLRGRAGDAVDSVKWLGKQRNSRGGFVSTQDTVVALQALSMYSQNITSIPLDMTVTVSHSSPTEVEDARELGVFSMEEADKLLLRRQTVSDLPSKLTVETKGSGCAMVQTVLRYNTPEAPANSGFTLTAAQEGSGLNVCGQYTGSQSKTGMVVMEVEMVSGWEARFSEIESLVNDVNYEIQRVERGKEDKDNVVLYFDSWPRDELCVTLPLKQDTMINEVKPAVVSLYDYYNTDDKATVLYSLK
jgi:alpha-2-macroglobulin